MAEDERRGVNVAASGQEHPKFDLPCPPIPASLVYCGSADHANSLQPGTGRRLPTDEE